MRKGDPAQAEAFREIGGELAEEQLDIGLALAEGRHLDLDGVEPVVEVFAKLAPADGVEQVHVRGCDHADIRLLHLRRAHLDVLAVLEDAEQLRLRGEGQFADLVQEEGAAVRLLEVALAGFHRTGEGALDVAEEFGVDCPLGDRAAVHREIFPVLAAAVLVDDLRDVFLADAALARDEDRQVRWCDGHRRFQGAVQRRVVPDDVEFIFEPL